MLKSTCSGSHFVDNLTEFANNRDVLITLAEMDADLVNTLCLCLYDLPDSRRLIDTLELFNSNLKTHLFKSAGIL